MPTATVTSKGQVTLPVALRRDLGIRPGTQVEFEEMADGWVRMRPRTGRMADLAGFFGTWEGPAASLEDMDRAVAAGAVESLGEGAGE
ncbi:MAG: AbrB/MazE/SpoVT family DNA-binding domain-containing protein [Bifidobacteriaceae bacterium]|jgi:AbrB family looped-hinge helix DNA binding protein|nr:AbrB/MazE/SpoVT family DNA-binding domain-containing protein [Bifidobacteriaceae bacterium]